MCEFFSLCSVGDGKALYFDAIIRNSILSGELNYTTDSHTSIAHYVGFKGKKEDNLNKYEYNVFTRKFNVNYLGAKDDSKEVEIFCNNLDFKTVVPELIIKPIIHPFKDRQCTQVTDEDIQTLRQWILIWASVRASVGDSVNAYLSSFFDIKYGYNFTSLVKLWEKGLIPSFDMKVWRLHGAGGRVVWKESGGA